MNAPTVWDLPTGEVALIEPDYYGRWWNVYFWGSDADYRADIDGPRGDWWDRSTVSIAVDTLPDAITELGTGATPRGAR